MINTLTERVSNSRGWAIGLGIAAAVLAAILLLVYLNSYRDSVAGDNARSTALVAKGLILKGTSGTVIAEKNLYQVSEIQNKELKVGAIADPALLNGRVAVADVYPGQQLTTADFSTETTEAVNTKISGNQRALSVSIDNIHGSLSQLTAGDRIDLYVAAGAKGNEQAAVRLFRPNVYVIAVPGQNESGNLMFRVNSSDAADFAFAADNTQMYFVIRPRTGWKKTRPDVATVQDILRTPRAG